MIYVTSYLHQYNSEVRLSDVAMAFPIQACAFAVGMCKYYLVTGVLVYHRWGGRVSLIVGVIPVVLGTLLASFLTDTYAFLLLYLCFTGYGASSIVVNSIWVGWATLPSKKGLASGVCMLGFGLGASIIGFGFSLGVNPDNEPPSVSVTDGNQHEKLFPPHIASRLQWTLRVAAITYAIGGLVSILLVEDRGSKYERTSMIQSFTSSNRANPTNCPSIKRALRTSAFWNLTLYAFCSNTFEMFMLVEYKNYALTVSHNDQMLSLIGSIGLLCNTTCRFLLASLMDYLPFKTLSMVVMLLQASLAVTMHFVVSMPLVYAVWVCVTFMCFSATFAPIALICGQVFGPMYLSHSTGSKVFPLVNQGAVVGIIAIVPIVEFIVKPYGYSPAFYVLAGIALAACGLLVQLRLKYDWKGDSMLGKEDREIK